MNRSFWKVLFFALIVHYTEALNAATYRICNKSGSLVKGQLNYYVLFPADACVGPSQFDLQNYQSMDISNDVRIAEMLYEQSLICCVMSIDVDSISQTVNRPDACKDLTFVIEKKDGRLSVRYREGLLDCHQA